MIAPKPIHLHGRNPPEHQRITQREDESPIWVDPDPVTSHNIELFDTLSVLAFGV